MDGIVGGVPASGPSGWQGGEVFSEVQRWNRIEADGQMKTPCLVPLRELQGFARAADIWYHICATGGSELRSSELKRSAMKKGKPGMVRQAKLGRTNRMVRQVKFDSDLRNERSSH